MNPKQHINRWVKEVNKYINLDREEDVIRFCLSYTLQSLRSEEDFSRFKWDEEDFPKFTQPINARLEDLE